MTTADEWRLEGRQEGERRMLLRQLRKRFGDSVDASVEQRINAAPLEQVEAWSDRVLDASTLSEVLAD